MNSTSPKPQTIRQQHEDMARLNKDSGRKPNSKNSRTSTRNKAGNQKAEDRFFVSVELTREQNDFLEATAKRHGRSKRKELVNILNALHMQSLIANS